MALLAQTRSAAASAREWVASLDHDEIGACTRVLVVVMFLRVLMPLVGFLANVALPMKQPEQFTVFEERRHLFWDIFARYDSGWYYTVATEGYRYAEGDQNNLGFFPVYPLTMRYVGFLFGGEQHHFYLAGLFISKIAFLIAMVLLYRIARYDLDRDGAQRAVLYTAIFPFAFFYGRVYSESLFLLFTLLAFCAFRTRRWELGGLAGGLASCTRVNGILALPALGWVAWRHAGLTPREWVRPAAALAAVAGGLGLFCAYVYTLTGSPFAWVTAIREWNYHPGGPPWVPLVAIARQIVRRPYEFIALEPNGPYDTLNGVVALVMTGSIPFVWRRLGTAYGLFMVPNLWLPLSSGHLVGLGRYCALLFPFFIWLASFRSQLLRDVVVITSVALYVLCLTFFIKLYPIY